MEILIKWFDGKYPSFNVALASKPGNDPFLEIKGCRLAKGKDGEFVSPPSTKGNNDKYWNHAYFSKEFAEVILKKAKESQPTEKPEVKKSTAGGGFDDFDSNIPF